MEDNQATPEAKPEPRPIYISKAQSVGDQVAEQRQKEAASFGQPKPLDKAPEADPTKPVTSDQDQNAEETDVIKDILNQKKGISKLQDKPNAEKRKEEIQAEIDKLTAQKKAVADELAQLEAKKTAQNQSTDANASKEEKVFTRQELAGALEKFVEQNDMTGVLDVFDYMLEQQEKKMVELYNKEKSQVSKEVAQKNEEWNKIVKDYSDYEDNALKSDTDFNIRNEKGKLFLLAKALYEDPEIGKQYSGMGGMSKAVKDAFTELLKEKYKTGLSGKPAKKIENPEVESLKNRLEKNNRKVASVEGAEAVESDQSFTMPSDVDKLTTAIKERKTFQKARNRGTAF